MNKAKFNVAMLALVVALVLAIVAKVLAIYNYHQAAEVTRLCAGVVSLVMLIPLGLLAWEWLRKQGKDLFNVEVPAIETPVVEKNIDRVRRNLAELIEDKENATAIARDLEIYATQLTQVVVGIAQKIDKLRKQCALYESLIREMNKIEPNRNYVAYTARQLNQSRFADLATAGVYGQEYWAQVHEHFSAELGLLIKWTGVYLALGQNTLHRLGGLEDTIEKVRALRAGTEVAVPLLNAARTMSQGSVRLQNVLATDVATLLHAHQEHALLEGVTAQPPLLGDANEIFYDVQAQS